jgi:hypothetical protein
VIQSERISAICTTLPGLYHIALDTDPDLKRVSTPGAEVYREIIAQRGVW